MNITTQKINDLADSEGFVSLGSICRNFLDGRQSQYVSRFIDRNDPDYPDLGDGLKLKDVFRSGQSKGTGNYHDYKIHKHDVCEFVKRVKENYGENVDIEEEKDDEEI